MQKTLSLAYGEVKDFPQVLVTLKNFTFKLFCQSFTIQKHLISQLSPPLADSSWRFLQKSFNVPNKKDRVSQYETFYCCNLCLQLQLN